MGYKQSIYNVVIDTLDDGRNLIYNTFSGILGLMDTKTQSVYNHIQDIDITQASDEETKKNIETMRHSGYIVDEEVDEVATVKLDRAKAKYSRDTLTLTIAPTMACNMRCPYCYESKTGTIMKEDTQDQLIKFVEAHINANPNLRYMRVAWYGGEPLLQKATIYRLSSKFIELCSAKNIEYAASMVSNGALLDVETAKKLAEECKVQYVQITIDGLPEQHNRRRIFADGSGSFDQIIKNIEDCRDFLRIHVRVNVDKSNAAAVEPLTNYFLVERGWVDNPLVYLAPVENYTDSCNSDASDCLQKQEFAEIDNAFRKNCYSVNREYAARFFFPRRNRAFCGAECLSSYVIDPEGYLFNCWLVIGKPEYRSGHITKPFLVNSEYSRWLSSEIPEKCEKCEYLPMCVGGCPYHRITNSGEPNCVKSLYNYKEILKLACQDYLEYGNKK